jgi:FdhD protein
MVNNQAVRLVEQLMTSHHQSVITARILCVTAECATWEDDEVPVEEPLEIHVAVPRGGRMVQRSIAITMRTPGFDVELTAGFLFTEGIIQHKCEIADLRTTTPNAVLATLASTARVDPNRLDRHSFVSSSCGVCGKRSIAAVVAIQRYRVPYGVPRIDAQVIHDLPTTLRAAQPAFDRTGGLHAAALFDPAGRLVSLYEDVGRHNALDKLIGSELLAGRMPLGNRLVLVSGRASFELIQKATVAGVPVLAAVGAPSSLAVTLARQSGMTLLGFVRDGRFNVYADAGRLTEAPAEGFANAGGSAFNTGLRE